MLAWPTLGLLAVSVLGTSFISGIFGMAGGMVLVGVLLALFDVEPAMLLFGATQTAANKCPTLGFQVAASCRHLLTSIARMASRASIMNPIAQASTRAPRYPCAKTGSRMKISEQASAAPASTPRALSHPSMAAEARIAPRSATARGPAGSPLATR